MPCHLNPLLVCFFFHLDSRILSLGCVSFHFSIVSFMHLLEASHSGSKSDFSNLGAFFVFSFSLCLSSEGQEALELKRPLNVGFWQGNKRGAMLLSRWWGRERATGWRWLDGQRRRGHLLQLVVPVHMAENNLQKTLTERKTTRQSKDTSNKRTI